MTASPTPCSVLTCEAGAVAVVNLSGDPAAPLDVPFCDEHQVAAQRAVRRP